MTTPGALTREQVEEYGRNLSAGQFHTTATFLLAHDAALRQSLAQQAQEVERVKGELTAIKDERALVAHTRCRKCGESCDVNIEYGRPLDSRDTEITKLRQCWKEELQKRCSVQAEREGLKQQLAAMTREMDEAVKRSSSYLVDLNALKKELQQERKHTDSYIKILHDKEQQLAAMTTERDYAVKQCSLQKEVADNQTWHVQDLTKQLAASQARCREVEKPSITLAECSVVDYLEKEVDQLLPKLGVEAALITDLSHVGDFPDEQLGAEKYVWQAAIDLLRNQNAQLQATLAAREAQLEAALAEQRILDSKYVDERSAKSAAQDEADQYYKCLQIEKGEHVKALQERDAAVQEAGRLREALRTIANTAHGTDHLHTLITVEDQAQRALSDSSGGKSNAQ